MHIYIYIYIYICKERKLLHITILQKIPPTPSVLDLFNQHSTEGKKHDNVNLRQKPNVKL